MSGAMQVCRRASGTPSRFRARLRRHLPERGAALVEAAVISPIVILLIIGVIEFGLLFKDYLTVANTTRAGARVATQEASNPTADYQVLQAIKGASSAMNPNKIERIVVFRATSPSGTVPATCKSGTAVTGSCNVYVTTDMNRPSSDFGCTGSSPDRFWCPTTRLDNQSDPPDYVGVYIQARHDYVTGMFGSARTLTDPTVMRIEPQP